MLKISECSGAAACQNMINDKKKVIPRIFNIDTCAMSRAPDVVVRFNVSSSFMRSPKYNNVSFLDHPVMIDKS
jgi:hypothetical protein